MCQNSILYISARQNIVLSIRQLSDSCSVSVGVGTPLIARLYISIRKNASPKNVPDLVLGISDLVRFTPIWSDLVIRVTEDSEPVKTPSLTVHTYINTHIHHDSIYF